MNVELLEQVYAHVAAHLEAWDQAEWRSDSTCGSTFCFAGWTAELTGALWLGPEAVVTEAGVERVDAYAARVLGLTPRQASALFLWCPTRLSRLRNVLDLLEAGWDGEDLSAPGLVVGYAL